MNRIAFFLPIVALAAAFVCGFDPHYWWAYALIAAAAEGILYLMFFLSNSSIEYISGYVTTLIHHFPWTEKVEHTETRKVGDKTEYIKRVSYHDHDDEYYGVLNTGEQIEIDGIVYKKLVQKWGKHPERISVHHSNCVRGGDGEQCEWNGKEEDTEAFTYTHRYRNPIKNSESELRGHKIKKDEALALGLYEYPEIEVHRQKAVLMAPEVHYTLDTKEADRDLQRLNAFCGASNQIHVFILLFPARDGSGTAFKQRDYWKGCNKNELVVCLGVEGKSVEWCETLSWMDEHTLDSEVKEYFRQNHNANLKEFVKWLREHIGLWKRKEVKEMKQISLMSTGNSVFLWSSALAFAALVLLCAYWIGGK